MGVLADTEIRRLSVEGWTETPPPMCMVDQLRQLKLIEPFAENEKRPGVISYGLSSYGYDMRIAGEFEVFTGPEEERDGVYRGLRIPAAIDPKDFNPGIAKKVSREPGERLIMPPHSFALGVSVEKFCIPRDIITICLGKSTYARCGLYVNITPFEPEWEGYPTIELTNPTPRPLAVYPFEGIAQLLFLRAETDLREFASVIGGAAWERPLFYPNEPKIRPPGEEQKLELVGKQVREAEAREYEERLEAWKRQIPVDGCRITCETSYADKGGKYQGQEARVVHPKVDPKKESS